MKSTVVLCLVGAALGAPTRTIEKLQLGDLGTLSSLIPSSDSSILGALESLIPSSSSGLGGSGSSSGIGALESLIPSGDLTGSSSSSGLDALTSLIPSLGSITKSQIGSITQNGVTDNSGCKELTFIFARGSDEMGNMGSVVGPEVATQLNSLTGNKVTVQGVTYNATAEVS